MLYRCVFKRIIDFLVALVLTLISLPLIIILCLLIRLGSKGFPIFVQTRVGSNEKKFKLFKLRSMVANAHNLGNHQTKVNDARITLMGNFIRKTSLDELPQIWNVLLGHMSFIGPRPDVPEQKAMYTTADWQERLKVRPGITGLAQVTGRSHCPPNERTQLDLTYVRNHTFFTDLKILWDTFVVITKIKGVN